jgi:DNA-directed RNA polymerase specialized sigma24 family protein
MVESTLGTEDAYVTLRPVFLQGLAAVARQGFVAPTSEAMDVVHDFFVEEWPAVQRTFNPAMGRLEPYAYRAFVRFARARIVRMRRLRGVTLDSHLIGRLAVPAAELSEMDFRRDQLGAALGALQPPQRLLIREYFGSGDSERAIARRHSLSRYRLRKQVTDGLWRVAVKLGRPTGVHANDWRVALALWRDARSIEEAASLLGLTSNQVRMSLRRNVQYIMSALGKEQAARLPVGDVAMTQTVGDLLLKVFSSPGDSALLDQVRARSEEILEFLERDDVSLESVSHAGDAEWTAQIYSALADSGLSDEDRETIAALAAISDSEEEQIGAAWQQVLLPNLPPDLADADEALVAIAPVREDEYRCLLETPAVRAALPDSEKLARRGLSPLTIFYATDAVGRLIERTMQHEGVSGAIVIDVDAADQTLRIEPPIVTREGLLSEIRESADLMSDGLAEPILLWALAAARHVPYLLYGLKTTPTETGLVARSTRRVFSSVIDRWDTTFVPRAEVGWEQLKVELDAYRTLGSATPGAFRAVTVSNIPSSCNARTIANVFASKGYRPLDVQMFVDRSGHALGLGLVRLNESAEPVRVVNAVDGTLIAGKVLTVSADTDRMCRLVDSALHGFDCTHGLATGVDIA